MTTKDDQAIRSGAKHVEETEHLASGISEPRDLAAVEIAPEDGSDGANLKTTLAEVTLSMFTQGSSTGVRVGNPHNASELYEQIYPSPDEANTAMLDGGILTQDQIPDPTQLAGTGIPLQGITAEQLEAAGLKRHGASTI
jgi:hypothetical protein